MKTTHFVFYLLSILLTACVPMSEFEADDKAGLNGSFEQSKNCLPVNWLIYSPKTVKYSDFRVYLDTVDFKEGSRSLCFDVKACSNMGDRLSPGLSYEGAMNKTSKYTISFWAKSSSCRWQAKVGAVNAHDGVYQTLIDTTVSINKWRFYNFEYQVPKNESQNRIRFTVNILSAGIFKIDQVEIKPKL